MQTNPEKYTKGVLAAASDIVKTEGAAFLLSGLGEQPLPTLIPDSSGFFPATTFIVTNFRISDSMYTTITVRSGPTVVGYGLEGALKFGFYETFKGLFKTVTPSQFVNFLMASVVAGGVASIVLVRGEEVHIHDVQWLLF